MKFLNNLYLLFLLGCSSIDYGYLTLIKEINSSNHIEDISTFLEEDYSFIRASQGKNQAIMILSEYNSGIETWVGANNEKLITYKGLIIASHGLNQDFMIHRSDRIKDLHLKNNFNTYISLSNPDAKFIRAEFTLKNKNSSKNCKNEYNYNVHFVEIGSNKSITICFNDNDKPMLTSQFINPLGKRLDIEYFYKY